MDSSTNRLLFKFFIALSSAFAFAPRAFGCYTSIFNFGDSLSDTGNLFDDCFSGEPLSYCFPPYGETFFHRPTGRCSDGRLILDFIAESLGVPMVQPYLGVRREGIRVEDFEKGLNFAVIGATALDASFLREKINCKVPTNYSLAVQLEWFRDAYSSVCRSSSIARCTEILKSSLVLVGEIGGNDYNYPFFVGRSFEEIKSLVPLVVKEIASTITELIKLGAENLMVPGNLPIGCNPTYLKIYGNSVLQNSENGCLEWLNEFSEYHNEHLKEELKQLRANYPHAQIMYADYYNSAMRFFNAPQDFGFTNTLQSCLVKEPPEFKTVCDDPSKYVCWDGIHLTEAAYRVIATGLLQGPYTTPQITTSCTSQNASAASLPQSQ